MPVPFQLTKEPIYDHCFSYDRSVLCITKNSTVEIYQVGGNGSPKLVATLVDHDKKITAVDISVDGKILTCSEDRNLIVYTKDSTGVYKPSLVLLRINRAATIARWSPNGQKFAVGSADRIIAVCYFEEENDWWVSKHIKKPIKSTILSLDWHLNNVLLLCGSTDGHVRVFSSFIKSVDSKPAPTVWGERLPFQTLCLDFYQYGGWIHDVKFSLDGTFLAYVNNSTLNVVYPSSSGDAQRPDAFYEVKTSFLSFNSLIFASNDKIIAGGHDFHPVVFEGNTQSGWSFSKSIDDPSKVKLASKFVTPDEEDEMNQRDALNLFRQMDLKGTKTTEKILKTIHQNSITKLKPYNYNGDQVVSFSSSGNDGKVVIFDV